MEPPIRLCMISFMFAPLVGGAEVRAEKQARALQAMGQQVLILTLRHDKRWRRVETLDGLPIIRLGGLYRQGRLRVGKLGHLLLLPLLFFTLWRLRHRYDMLHACQLGSMAAVAALVGKLFHKPLVVSVPTAGAGEREPQAALMRDTLTTLEEDFFVIDLKEAVAGDISYISRLVLGGNAMMKFLKKSAAYYHILSRRSQTYLVAHGFRTEQIVYIPNGVDTEKYSVLPVSRHTSSVERVIVCVARLQYPKGIDVLLHAWGRMMREMTQESVTCHPRLLLVGEGPLRLQLERISHELGIEESVEFLGLRRDVLPLLQTAWGFVLPSRWEGMPNALLEAMACGVPCIATRVSGSEDIIEHETNGLLVPPLDPAALARALKRLIEDAELAQRLAHAGRATALHDYQLNMVAEQFLALYRLLLKRAAFPAVEVGKRT